MDQERRDRPLGLVLEETVDGRTSTSAQGNSTDGPTGSFDLADASPAGLRRLYQALLDGFSAEERAQLETLIRTNVQDLRRRGDNYA